jgi:hypothetical protein
MDDVGTQTQSVNKSWKERRAIAGAALARLKADERNDAYMRVLAVHDKALHSDDPKKRELAEEICNAYHARDMNRLIRAVNRMHRVCRWSVQMHFAWLIPVPLSWMKLEISMLSQTDYPEDVLQNTLLIDKNNLCFGLECYADDFFPYLEELEACEADPDYVFENTPLTGEQLKNMLAGVEECRIKAGVKSWV